MNEQLIIDLRLLNFDKLNELNEALAKSARLFDGSTRAVRTEGAAVLRTQKAVAQYERTVKGLIKDKEKLKLTDQQYNQGVEEALRLANLQIATDKDLIKLAKERNRKREEEKRAEEKLVRLYAPKTAAAKEYQRVIEELDAALKANIITEDDHAESLERVHTEFEQFTSGLATGGNQFAKFNVEAYKATQSTKRFASVGLQQAGYQIGDFAVQVQSGTNVAVAFGQQMSQLLGIFGAGGALAGAGVAIATAFIAPLLDAEKSSRQLREALDELDPIIDSITENFSDLTETFGENADGVKRIREEIVLLKKSLADSDIKTTLSALTSSTRTPTNFTETLASINTGLLRALPFGNLIAGDRADITLGKMGISPSAVGSYSMAGYKSNMLNDLNQAMSGGNSDEAQNILEAFIKAIKESESGFEGLTTEGKIFIAQLNDAVEAAIELDKKFKDLTGYADKQATAKFSAQLKVRSAMEARFYELKKEREQDLLDDYNRNIVQRFKNEEALMDQEVEIHKDVKDAIKKRADEAAKALKKIIDDFERTAVIIDVRFQAETDVMGQNYFRGAAKQTKYTYEKLLEMGVSPEQLQAMGYKPKEKKGRKTKTKTPAEQLGEYLTNLRSQAELEKDLVGVSSQRYEIEQELFKLKLKYGDLITPQVEQEVTNQMKLKDAAEQARQQRMDQLQQEADMYNFVAKSYGDFLYDVLAGNESTAKSFENMANKVIAHLFDVLVMQQMIGTVGVDGKAGTGLLGILGFEGGGYTGRGPRSGGIDGRGGFMAVLHPNETVIDHTKGQGGGSVVINQNFNIAANGDDTVRQIVANEAPKIANMATAAVLEKRKRGGAMRSTFG